MPKRGLIVLILVWSVLLFLPAFAPQARKTIQNLDGVNRSFYHLRDDWAAIEKSHPDHAQLAFLNLRAEGDPQKSAYWRDLDALVARFPDDLNLRRARLIESTRSGKLVRPIYSPLGPKADPLPTAADRKASQDWQNQAQRAAIVEAARLGEQQAPNDGFFAWMEALALWNRDDESALEALERAARASDFDDGVMANQRALLQLRNQQTPLDWEEKLALMSGALLPHYANLRVLAREVTWSGIAHYRRGDKAGAYRRWRIALEAGGAFRRAQSRGPQSILIGLFVAEATQRLVWQSVAAELDSSVKADDSNEAKLRAFEALAKRDGQGDLAAYAVREYAGFEGQKLGKEFPQIIDKLGTYSPIVQTSVEISWVGGRVFWLSIAGAFGLFVCLIWRWRVGGARWFGASAPQIAFFGALWLGALGLALWGRVASQLQLSQGLTDEPTAVSAASLLFDFFAQPWAIWLAIATTLALSIAFVYWGNIRETKQLQQQITPRANAATSRAAWLPKLISVAWSLVLMGTLLWFMVSGNETYNLLARAIWIGCCLLALALTFWRVERGESSDKPRARWALIGAVCALATLGLAAQFGVDSNDIAFYIAATSLLLATAILIYLAANSRGWRATLPRALAVALQTLGGVAALCAVALLLASLAALPVRARQNRIVNDYIKRGEIDWMRSQMQIHKVGNQP